jgi:hypothetical protein
MIKYYVTLDVKWIENKQKLRFTVTLKFMTYKPTIYR